MSLSRWVEVLVSAQADGPSLSNTTVPTSIINPQCKVVFPPNYFDTVGKGLLVRGSGRLSNIVTTPGTLTLDLRFGGTVVFNGGAMQLSTTAHTTLPFMFEMELLCRGIGTAATFIGQGRCESQCLSLTAAADNASTIPTILMPNTNPAAGLSWDSTAQNTLDLFATFSVNNTGNLIQTVQYEVVSLN